MSEAQQTYYRFVRRALQDPEHRTRLDAPDIGYLALAAQEVINDTNLAREIDDGCSILHALYLYAHHHTASVSPARDLRRALLQYIHVHRRSHLLRRYVLATLSTYTPEHVNLVLDGVLSIVRASPNAVEHLVRIHVPLAIGLDLRKVTAALFDGDDEERRAFDAIVLMNLRRYPGLHGRGSLREALSAASGERTVELKGPAYQGFRYGGRRPDVHLTAPSHTRNNSLMRLLLGGFRAAYALLADVRRKSLPALSSPYEPSRDKAQERLLRRWLEQNLPSRWYPGPVSSVEPASSVEGAIYTIGSGGTGGVLMTFDAPKPSGPDTQNLGDAQAAPTAEPDRFSATLSVSFTGQQYMSGEEALNLHRELVNDPGSPATYVHSGSRYQVHLGHMEAAQRAYYLHWRAQWRKGHAPMTDDGYLQTYVVEIVNLIGFADPDAAAAELLRLTTFYLGAPYGYMMIGWLTTFLAYHPLARSAESLLWDFLERETGVDNDRGIRLDLWLRERSFERLKDPRTYQAVTGFTTRGASYHERMKDPLLVQNALVAAVQAAADEYRSRKREDLFAHYFPDSAWSVHHLHRYAPLLISASLKQEGMKFRQANATAERRLHRLLTEVSKYAENLCRAHDGVRGRRQLTDVKAFTKGMREAVDRAVQEILNPPRPFQLDIDLDRLAQLERDSARTRERLVDPAALVDVPTQEPPAETASPPSPPAVEAEVGWPAVVAHLSEAQRSLVDAVAHDQPERLTLLAREHGVMLDVLVEQVNELAMLHTGDLLLDTYEEPLRIIEEHREALARALA